MEVDWNRTYAAVWRSKTAYLRPVHRLDPVSLETLIGVETQKDRLCENTERFLKKLPANHALLWGARGTGKSSLIKGVLNRYATDGLRAVEVAKDDLGDLQEIVDKIETEPYRFLIYCDDLSFEEGESSYKALKSVLEGSLELPPENVLIYATSNRRHLLPEYQYENTGTRVGDGELHYSDSVEEKISLSDRFGLWLSFYHGDLAAYLAMVDALFPAYADRDRLHRAAREFAALRGNRSGRTARQFFNAFSDSAE